VCNGTDWDAAVLLSTAEQVPLVSPTCLGHHFQGDVTVLPAAPGLFVGCHSAITPNTYEIQRLGRHHATRPVPAFYPKEASLHRESLLGGIQKTLRIPVWRTWKN